MRILFGAISLLVSTLVLAEELNIKTEAELQQWLNSSKPKVENGEYSDKNAATLQAVIAFAHVKGLEVETISPQLVNFKEGIAGFSKPNENVWEVGIKDIKSSKLYLYFVHPVSGNVIQRCLDAKRVLTSQCS